MPSYDNRDIIRRFFAYKSIEKTEVLKLRKTIICDIIKYTS